MKRLLIGILALTSVSAFANYSCLYLTNTSVWNGGLTSNTLRFEVEDKKVIRDSAGRMIIKIESDKISVGYTAEQMISTTDELMGSEGVGTSGQEYDLDVEIFRFENNSKMFDGVEYDVNLICEKIKEDKTSSNDSDRSILKDSEDSSAPSQKSSASSVSIQ
jgi:hypothetical protein